MSLSTKPRRRTAAQEACYQAGRSCGFREGRTSAAGQLQMLALHLSAAEADVLDRAALWLLLPISTVKNWASVTLPQRKPRPPAAGGPDG